MDKSQSPRLGQFVKSLKGRDSGEFGIVIAIIEERYLLIADGDKRKFDKPKKKNINHLELLEEFSEEIVNSLDQSGRVTNGKLRYALNQFIEDRRTNAEAKGD